MVSSASYNSKELLAGAFLLLLIGYLAYVALGLGRWRTIDRTGYLLYANFFSVSGLDVGAPVEIAGVPVGRVDSIALGADNQAQVALRINDHVTIDQIAVASIGREGIPHPFSPVASDSVLPCETAPPNRQAAILRPAR
jgi:phospholipid/cholesterol/gamma-HCH transport system substrate-binding protein